jgi:glutaredoxin
LLRRFGSALAVAVLGAGMCAIVSAATPPDGAPGADSPELFVREGCPRCADAERFVEKLRREQPGLQVTVRDVSRDRQALERLEQLVAKSPGQVSGVPALHAHGELLIGFTDEETSGARIRALLARAPPPAGKAADPGEMCKIAQEAPCATPDAGSFEIPGTGRRISIDDVGLPLFTVVIGLVDGFNPCSMWVLILMVSMLASVGDRRRMIAIAGTFVAVEGIAYFAFMAAWLNLFLLIGISRASEIVLGVIALVAGLIHVKDYFAFGRGVSLSIPASAKPGIYQRMRGLLHEQSLAMAIAGTVVLAVLVQLVELLCTSGLPALYTRILTLRKLDPWSYYGYLLLYNVVYMLDDVIVLTIGVVTLSQKRLQEKEGRQLKLISGVVMLLLGLYLVVMPT